jgi:Fe-S oxidoreductase
LFDYGFLNEAKRYLQEITGSLRAEITAGTPVVCLEPSCASVFKDEMTNLMPHDEDAQRLRIQTSMFGDFLEKTGYPPPLLKRKALVHGHCHHKAIFGLTAEEKLLSRMGLDAETLDAGCCGLAGSFGYEADHYEISMKIGERVLLPKVRAADRETLIIADGFSCREQIMHGTPRHAMHLAEVIQMGMRQAAPKKNKYVEIGFVQEEPGYPVLTAAGAVGAFAAAGFLFFGRRPSGPRGGALEQALTGPGIETSFDTAQREPGR